ncbi:MULTISPECIES: flagellin N-terminal helical domain-containing protein [Rhizobiaceae]|uniref:Flagellin n=1 Tax=Peteryoungia algae TaxID=2919917 RepID=A0ABT0CVZ9_9HYPH|nr:MULTISPECIES: flagellin [unclassified Rhizobium]MCC8931406.1 flagellin [Rhizobium sp. 'Codium 1']MCJ8237341.1 flagellin [Rhizobium sp. SSM4.3]
MTSILTNVAAMSALQTLRTIGSSMEDTQARVSSGLRVGEASDNAAYWSIATTMKSDNMALSAVSDALGLGASKIDTAYAGMESAIDVVKEIKAKLVTATEEGVDKAKVQEEITQLQGQLKSIADSASFSGENWIAGGTDTSTGSVDVTVVSGFVRDASNNVAVKTTSYTLDATTAGSMTLLFGGDAAGAIDTATGILGATGADYTTTDFDSTVGGVDAAATAVAGMSVYTLDINGFDGAAMAEALTLVDAALAFMTSAGADLGSISMRIDLQEDFVNKLSDSLDSGVGRLVDADMNEESTRLKALQTQQQLAVQSLSIANSSSEVILSLFR